MEDKTNHEIMNNQDLEQVNGGADFVVMKTAVS